MLLNNTINIFLDDYRNPADLTYMPYSFFYFSEKFEIVRNYEQFVEILEKCLKENLTINSISFDHDLCESHYDLSKSCDYDNMQEHEYTGYHCLIKYLEFANDNSLKIKNNSIHIHTMNGDGLNNMKDIIDRYVPLTLGRLTPQTYLNYHKKED